MSASSTASARASLSCWLFLAVPDVPDVPDGSDVEPVDYASHADDEEVELGARASAGNPCSLPVLEVWEVESDAVPDDPEPSAYGLADGCRYGSAWLFAPLLWGRTRRRSSRSGDRP